MKTAKSLFCSLFVLVGVLLCSSCKEQEMLGDVMPYAVRLFVTENGVDMLDTAVVNNVAEKVTISYLGKDYSYEKGTENYPLSIGGSLNDKLQLRKEVRYLGEDAKYCLYFGEWDSRQNRAMTFYVNWSDGKMDTISLVHLTAYSDDYPHIKTTEILSVNGGPATESHDGLIELRHELKGK